MYLRKWSPIKYLMYLWLAILVWIFCRCESAATMHLAPASSSSSFPPFSLSYASGTSSSSRTSSSISSGSSSDNFSASRNSISELFANRNRHRVPAANPRGDTSELVDSTSPYQWRPSTPESTISSQRPLATPHLTKLFSQAASNDNRRLSPPTSGVTPSSYHHPINYANRMLQQNANSLPLDQPQQQLPNLPASLSQSPSNHDSLQVKTNYVSSSSISNTSISAESATLAEKRLQQQWKLRMNQKRARRLAHRRHLTEQSDASTTNRNRRDSARVPLPGGSQQPPPRRGPAAGQGGPGGQPRRYCSARDPATLAFDAPVVFEGKVKSMSSDRRANFSVTFEIVRVHKKHTKYPLEMFQQVRLQFSFRNWSECDIYRETYRERGIVREELEQGKVYFLFVKQIDLSNFTILGQPIRKTRRTANGVMEGVKDTYGKPPKIYSMTSNVTRQEGKRVRLVCKVQGEPPPKVTWFKDKRSINRNVTKYAQVHLKKRSELIIHSVIPSDAGEYECRAKNKYAKISNSTHVRVTAKHSSTKQPKTTHSTEPPYNPRPCRGPGAEHFCLNRGTCIHFEDLQEWACTCPKGFSGNKCENKVIDYHPTTSSKHQDCSYGYGYGGHPECADFLLMDSPVALPMIPPMYDYDDDSDI